MHCVCIILLLLLPYMAVAQTPAEEDPIWLNDTLLKPALETSSLNRWQDKIFLVPQYPDSHNNHIWCIDTASILHARRSEAKRTIAAAHAFTLIGLDKVKDAIEKQGAVYEGIEATATDNDHHIYFSIETRADVANCYLVKGTINGKKRIINLGKPYPLPRPKQVHNAGFETLTYMPDKDRLIAFYEFNRDAGDAKAYIINPHTMAVEEVLQFDKPLYFRITDAAYLGNGRLAAMNYYYKGDKNTYLGTDEHMAAARGIIGADPSETCYGRIIELSIQDRKIHYKPLLFISNGNDNWEGITPLGNGYLVVVDGRPPGRPCKLSWFPVK